jgi:filamentous hemagglutinin
VSIQASQSLENSVIRQDYQPTGGAGRVGNTAAQGTGKTTIIQLNPQLPPDLQQQQINPLSLPGFTLPQGENGLFRLNGQNAATRVASGALGATGDSTLAGSSVTVGTGQTAQGPVMTSGSTWSLQNGQGTGSAIGATPIGAASLGVAGVQNLPSSTVPRASHNYLIETNPELTNLKQFLGSDYLLGNLGYTPDNTQKRLGDGLYEQRLIREAVVARTGQRFLAGLSSDEAMFRYLMDNAIASKQALKLPVGVTLTAAQVAALTHDIVWLEEHEVMGEKVLVPVLYLAQAEGRLAPNGALIQGQDVSLISGGDLLNQGTLRASHNLSAVAGGSLGNRGLIEAGNRLDLLASDSIRNAQGGIIAGRDVSLTALNGDVINERSVTRHEVEFGNRHNIQDVADSAARIEAANSLSISAGRDVANLGGVFDSRGDLAISAGRDVTIASVEERNLQARGSRYVDEQVRQLGAQVSAGRDIEISAGRDLTAIASQIDARRDIALVAGGDVLLASAANEDHFLSRSKKVTRSSDTVVQQSTTVQAGRNITIAADSDLSVVASQVKAGNNVALDAGQDINILSAIDESASFYAKKSKGSFGRSKSQQKEKYDSTNVASLIEAGNDLTLNTSKAADGSLSIDGGRDVTVIGSQLKAGNDLLVGATGDVAILSGIEEHGAYSKKTKSGFLGLSKSGKSQLKTKASQVSSELEAGNDVVIAAGNDIRLRASETTAGNDVELRAGLVSDTGDINLVSANDSAYSRSTEYKKKVGLSFSDAVGLAVGTPSWGGDIALSTAKKAGKEAISSTSVGSQVTADRDATLAAERDINIIGSGVSAGRNVLLDAGRDVNVVAGSSSQQTTSWENTKSFGMKQDADRNGFSTFVGEEKLTDKKLGAEQSAAASQIEAGLDLNVNAGRDIVQQGSDLGAGYDINLQAGRNILIDAAQEQSTIGREQGQERSGTTTTVNHNFGNTMDALGGAGEGDNSVSQVSSVLKAADSVSQFLSGPTFDAHTGNTSHSQSVTQIVQGNRASTLDAGNDINLLANNDVDVRGGQFQAGRDINVKGENVTFDVAQGEQRFENQQTQSKGGVVGGTTGGFKIGIGGSSGVAKQEGAQGTSSAAQLSAARDINMEASHDLSLIGTRAQAGRDIDLKAGNDLRVRAATNQDADENSRRSGGGEVGLTFGSDGIGVYASVNIGRGHLDREGARQQEAYLYAGRDLGFESGRDTIVAGAVMEGENVVGEAGRNLIVSSVPSTGKVSGREFDLSATVTVGYGVSVSGSVGYGQTTGKTEWVDRQTSIVARDKLDIRTENHTQIDGALIASQTGNLKLDTDTLGFRDIKGEDKEHSYYLNAGGSYGTGQQDSSQSGKGESGANGWSLEGYDYRKEREQIVRATVGEGEIVVRRDAETGQESTAGLNRDTSKA